VDPVWARLERPPARRLVDAARSELTRVEGFAGRTDAPQVRADRLARLLGEQLRTGGPINDPVGRLLGRGLPRGCRERSRGLCRSAALPFDLWLKGPRGARTALGEDRTMKYMLIMRATDEAAAGMANIDFGELLEKIGRYNDEMIRAGVLVAGEGLDDAADGVVVDHSSEPPVVTDGPYGETKELFGGFYILSVSSKEEAVEWAKRSPMTGPGLKTEIRRVATIDEFPQDNEWIQKERAWREATGQL
jgi:hypothetical protein